jgi:hypothetical protein
MIADIPSWSSLKIFIHCRKITPQKWVLFPSLGAEV